MKAFDSEQARMLLELDSRTVVARTVHRMWCVKSVAEEGWIRFHQREVLLVQSRPSRGRNLC